MEPGYAGAIANMRLRDLISRTCEDAGLTPFGVFVAKGTVDRTVTKNLTGKTSVVGLVVMDRGARMDGAWAGEGFAQYDSARIADQGSVWVKVGVAVVAEEAAYVTPANPGVITNVATGNIRVGKFEKSAAVGGLTVLNVDLS